MNETEKQIEFLINTAEYNKILDLLNQEVSRQKLKEEDYYFYKSYCLCKLENKEVTNEVLSCFIKVLSINVSLKYKNSILGLIRDMYFNKNYYIELNQAKEFVNKLKKILPPEDIFVIKIFYWFYWMGIYSPEEFAGTVDSVLKVNKSNPEIYEIKANLCSEWDRDLAIENLQTALLLNKNAKDRYLKQIKKLKEEE